MSVTFHLSECSTRAERRRVSNRTIASYGTTQQLRSFERRFGYTSHVSPRPQIRDGQDKRDVGRYSIPEAAGYLAVPSRTMRRWFLGDRRLFTPSYRRGDDVLLSFNDVTEAYIIEVLRNHYDFRPTKLRTIVEALRVKSKLDKPLAQREFYAIPEFQSFVDRRTVKGIKANIDLAHHGNLVFDEFVAALGKRVQRDSRGRACRLYPWKESSSDESPLSMDPDVLSGELVVSGTRIPATMLYAKKLSGRTAEEIARSYHLEPALVRKVLNHFEREKP
jgi:uncharacterized protein (DUF433 family)